MSLLKIALRHHKKVLLHIFAVFLLCQTLYWFNGILLKRGIKCELHAFSLTCKTREEHQKNTIA